MDFGRAEWLEEKIKTWDKRQWEGRGCDKIVPVIFSDCGKIDMLKREKDVTVHHLLQRHINVSDLFLH